MSEKIQIPSGAVLAKTPLHELHVELGARMVPFAGYEMPLQYPMGILGEHLHTREKAALFDVSHMGQAFLQGADHTSLAGALEALVPADILALGRGRQRYTQLLNNDGGIIDDLIVTRSASPADDGSLHLVVNAARKTVDFAHLREHLADNIRLQPLEEQALLALQGPQAAKVMARWCPGAAELSFMSAAALKFDGIDCHVSRSGYTGEDGFEISVAAADALRLARTLLSHADVASAGLGARDSLRLEAGLCLYGAELDETTSPVEAGLAWSIGKRRRQEGGFAGAARICAELADGPKRIRVGIAPEGGAPAREGTEILSHGGSPIGLVTSGGFGPSFDGPVSMGYVEAVYGEVGAPVSLVVRGKPRPAHIVALPFVAHRYVRAQVQTRN